MARFLAAVSMTLIVAGCSRNVDTAPPVATPEVVLARPEVVVGGPIELKYRFTVAPDAPPFADDYWVFVHFLDTDGELMWTDDHPPPTPTKSWKAGQAIEYERTIFVPRFPYVGDTSIEVGLFSRASGARLPLQGESRGQRAYKVASFNLQLQGESLFVIFKEGWHPTEQAEAGREWQWSKKEGILAFRNPKRDVMLYLDVDRPGGFSEPQQVEVRLGDTVIDSFSLASNQASLRKIALTPAQLGGSDTTEVRIFVDRTFVPATMPEMDSRDSRELGVRVFRAFVEPK